MSCIPSDLSEVETKFISGRVFWLMIKRKSYRRGSNVRKKLCCIVRTLEGGSSRIANSAARKKVSFSSRCHSSE